MKKRVIDFLRSFMYLCFIIGVLSFISAIFIGIKPLDNSRIYETNPENTFLILIGVFIGCIFIGFLISDLLKRIDY